MLYFAMFVMGACGLAYEYTLSKVASDILGNSVRKWAIIIGIMMFFMGVGSDLQKRLSDSDLVDKFVLFEVLIGLLGAFGPIALLFSYAVIPSHYILVQYFFVISIGLIIGFEIPIITRINDTFIKELRLNLGSVLKMDYIGSLIGSLAWIFLLPKYFTIVETAFILGLFNILVALCSLLFFKKMIRRFKTLLVITLFVILFIVTGFRSSEGWTSYSEQRLYRDKVILSETTPFQHIVMTRSRAGDVKCFINGQLQFNSFDEQIYHEHLVHPAMILAESRKRVLILGGGDGLALREVLKYPDVEEVTLCDIDPAMTRLAQTDPDFLEINRNSLNNSRVMVLENNAVTPGPILEIEEQNEKITNSFKFEPAAKVHVINLDAAKFVEQIAGLYDVIIIDFPDPNNQDLAKLYSDQFYQNVRKKLAAFGLFVQQSTSPVHAKETFLCIGRTMQHAGLAVVPYHDNVPSFGEWGWWIGGKSESWDPDSIMKKMKNIQQIPVETRYLSPDIIRASLYFGKDQLVSEQKDISTLADARVYQYYLKAWQR